MAQNQTYTFTNEIDTLEIGSLGAKIIVRANDGEGIRAEYSNPQDYPEFAATLSGKTLALKEQFSLNIFGNKPSDDHTITVYIPALSELALKINTASGGADVSSVTAKSLDLNTASGSISVNAFFDAVSVQSASGNITLESPVQKRATSLKTCTVSGSTTIVNYPAEKFSVHSVSGKTSMNGAVGEGSVSVTSGNVDIAYSEWNADLSVSVISGNVNISLPEGAGFELKYDGISGVLKTDVGCDKGSLLTLGKGTTGEFGGENKHKLNVSLTSGTVVVAQN